MKNERYKKGRRTKYLAILLAVVMVAGLFPYNLLVAAETTGTLGGYDFRAVGQVTDPIPPVLAAGQIWTDRSVSENPDGSFTVTLRALGNKYADSDKNDHDPLVAGTQLIITDPFNSDDFGFSSNDGLTAVNGAVTWTLDASALNLSGIPNSVTYTLTLKPGVYRDNGEYYTHTDSADAKFEPVKGNTYYWEDESVTANAFGVSNISWNSGNPRFNNITIKDNILDFTAPLTHNSNVTIKGRQYTNNGTGNTAVPEAGSLGLNTYRFGLYKSGPYTSGDKYEELKALAAGTPMANAAYYYEFLFWFYGLDGPGSVVVYQVVTNNPGGNEGAPGYRYVSYTEWNKKNGVGWQNDGKVHMDLSNTGYIKLVNAQLDPINIDVTKAIASYAGAGGGTFNFVLYADAAKTVRVDGAEISASNGNPGTKTLTIPKEYLNFAGDKTSKTFYLAEVAPAADPEFWSYDRAVREVVVASNGAVTIDGVAAESVTFTNRYTPLGELTVAKKWENTPDDEKCPISVSLFDSKGERVDSGELNAGNNWAVTFYGLYYGETYNAVEDANALSTDFAAPSGSGPVTLVYGAADQKVNITNYYNTPKATITVEKEWQHGANDDSPLLTDVMVYLWQDGVLIRQHMTNERFVTFTGLDIGPTYIVTEDVPEDYLLITTEGQRTVTPTKADRVQKITLTNVFVPRVYKLTIIKDWNAAPGVMPESVNVDLYKDDIKIDTVELRPSANPLENWRVTLTTGIVPGHYRIEETTLDNYFTVAYTPAEGVTISKAAREGTLQLTNTDDDPKGTIKVNKVWADYNQTELRSGSVTVTLLKDGASFDELTLNDGNEWKGVFTDLDLEAEYTVEESGAPGLYDVSYSDPVFLTRGQNNHEGAITITNTYGYGVITVDKKWMHGDNDKEAGFSNLGAVIYLYKSVEDGEDILIEEPFEVGNEDKSKTYYYLDIDATYYVEEYVNDQYYRKTIGAAAALDENNPNGVIYVTNRYEAPKGSITVEKQWLGNTDPSAPQAITVGLFFGAEEEARDTITLSGPGWTGAFTDVPINTAFEVREMTDLGNNYKTPVVLGGEVALGKHNLSASVTIKNEYVTPTGKLEVKKAWGNNDEPAAGEERPDTVEVQLMRSIAGEMTVAVGGPEEITADGSSFIFSDLPLYDADGNTYTYSVVELYVKGYVATYSSYGVALQATNAGGAAETIIITNEFQTDVGRITAVKDWNDVPEDLRTPVRVALFKGDTMVRGSGRILSARHNWRTTWSRLELGATYSVRELTTSEDWYASYGDGVSFGDSYSVTLTRTAEAGRIFVRNNFIPEEHEVDLVKGADEEAVIIGGIATIKYQIRVMNSGNRTLTDVEITDAFSDYPAGANIVFKVDCEGELYGYDEETGVFTIAALAPGEFVTIRYTVEADLKGEYVNDVTVTAVYKEQEVYGGEDDAKTEVLRPELALVKSVTSAASQTLGNTGGATLTFGYKLTIGNNGDVIATVTSLKDVMEGPAGSKMTYIVTTEGVSYDADEHSFIFAEALILEPKGEPFVITYNVMVDTVGTYGNNAEVDGYYVVDGEEIPLNAKAKAEVKVDRQTYTPYTPPTGGPEPTPEIIPPPEIPLVERPAIVIEEPDEPVVEPEIEEPVEFVPDPDTPLANLPQTGVLSIYSILLLIGASLTAMGMAARLVISVKSKNKSNS